MTGWMPSWQIEQMKRHTGGLVQSYGDTNKAYRAQGKPMNVTGRIARLKQSTIKANDVGRLPTQL